VQGGFGGRFGGYTVYYHMVWVSEGNDQVAIFNDSSIDKNMVSALGTLTGAIITTNSSKFEIYIGISYVSHKNAKLNLETEIGNKRFDQIKA
jgi:putative alpha-1,2-mannosidase